MTLARRSFYSAIWTLGPRLQTQAVAGHIDRIRSGFLNRRNGHGLPLLSEEVYLKVPLPTLGLTLYLSIYYRVNPRYV